jgi:hypothetical protein
MLDEDARPEAFRSAKNALFRACPRDCGNRGTESPMETRTPTAFRERVMSGLEALWRQRSVDRSPSHLARWSMSGGKAEPVAGLGPREGSLKAPPNLSRDRARFGASGTGECARQRAAGRRTAMRHRSPKGADVLPASAGGSDASGRLGIRSPRRIGGTRRNARQCPHPWVWTLDSVCSAALGWLNGSFPTRRVRVGLFSKSRAVPSGTSTGKQSPREHRAVTRWQRRDTCNGSGCGARP